MPRFNNGWVAISRRLMLHDRQANEFFGDPALFCVWTLLIGWANVVPSKVRRRGLETPVQRGDVITSLREIGAQWAIGVGVVRRCLDYLAATHRISIVDNTAGLHIRICKYEEYQNPNHADNTPANTTTTRAQHDDDTSPTRRQHRIEPSNQETKEPKNHLFTAEAAPSSAPPRSRRASRSGYEPAKSTATWDAYSIAYMAIHGDLPESTAPARSMACKLVDLVGKDLAPAVAEYYVLQERAAWVMRDRHPLGELVRNAQKYLTNYRTGTKITSSAARSLERDDGNRNAVDSYLANKHRAASPNGV